MDNNIARTRIHEAGHAVASVLLGQHVAAIVTAPTPGHDPATQCLWDDPLGVEVPVVGEARKLFFDRIVVSLAGEAVAIQKTGKAFPKGCTGDEREATRWARSLLHDGTTEPSEESTAVLVDVARKEATEFVSSPLASKTIDELAAALTVVPNMLGEDLEKFFRDRSISMPVAWINGIAPVAVVNPPRHTQR
jgi:hypothetical protein